MNLLYLAWKNITAKPLKTLLSVLLFALGVGLVSLLFLLNKQLNENFEKNLAGIDLVVGAKGSPLQLILSGMYHIDAPTGNISLKEARPFLNPKHPLLEQAVPLALGDSYKGHRIVGTSHDYLGLYGAEFTEGAPWQRDFEVVLGGQVARKYNHKLGDEFYSSHGLIDDGLNVHDDVPGFKVVGILEPNGSVIDQLVLTSPQTYWKVHEGHDPADSTAHAHHEPELTRPLLGEPDDRELTSLLLKFRGRSYQALNLGRNINENTDMQAASPAIEINRLYTLMDQGQLVLRILAIVIILVSALSIFISLYASLKDRRYELAIMRVLGSNASRLFALIILEGLIIAVLGYILGIALSHLGMAYFAQGMEADYRYTFEAWRFVKEEAYLLVAALGIGFLAALLPAIQASRTDISDTLAKG